MKKLTLFTLALLCLYCSIAEGQTFQTIDALDWAVYAGQYQGTTSQGISWDARNQEAKDCDGAGYFGVQGNSFRIQDWEGTCGCDCGPGDPGVCGQNNSTIDLTIPNSLLNPYCQVRLSYTITSSGTLECGTANDKQAAEIIEGGCMEPQAEWAGSDYMILKYNVFYEGGGMDVITRRVCGEEGVGLQEETFENVLQIQLTISGGTQEADEYYDISTITVEGVEKSINSLSVFAINHDGGYICQNSSLPLILQTNADPDYTFYWTGPNNFVSENVRAEFATGTLTPDLSGTYNVQVIDANGCLSEASIEVEVRGSATSECTSFPEFSLFGIMCSYETLPTTSDNGVTGSWSPGSDLSAFAGQTLDFTFTPDDPGVQTFEFTIEVDDVSRLDNFAIQPNPVPVFCNNSSERFDLIELFQMDMSLFLSINGEEDIFYFIDIGETINDEEAAMRSVSFENITPGEKNFFIEAISSCGEVSQRQYKFIVAPGAEIVTIDTALCAGDYIEFLGERITEDTFVESGGCGGGFDFRITSIPAKERRQPIVFSGCALDFLYVYDTVDTDGSWVGFQDVFIPEYELAIDTVWGNSYNGQYVLPLPASNGCDSIVNVRFTKRELLESKTHRIEFDICANKDTVINAFMRDYRIPQDGIYLEIPVGCDSAIIIDANLLPVEVDSVISTFCADQDTMIENHLGQMIRFDKDYSSDVFYWEVGDNGCSKSKVVDLTFIEPVYHYIDETICVGQAVNAGGQVFTTETINEEILLSRQSGLGCDSILVVNVTMIDAEITSEQLTCDLTEVKLNTTQNGTVIEWTGPNGFSSTDQSPIVTDPGLYTLTIEGPNGCQTDFTHNVSQDIISPTATVAVDLITCSSGLETQISYSSTGDLVAWRGPNGYFSTDNIATATEPGTYTIELVGANGCTFSRDFEVEADISEPTGTATGGVLDCNNNQEVTLGLTTNDQFVGWTGPNGYTSTDITPTVTEEGTYTVTLRAANGCETSIDAEVTLDIGEPDIIPVGGELSCDVPSLFIDAMTTGTIVSWTGPDGFATTDMNPEVTVPGDYEVTVMGTNGCTATATVVVTDNLGLPEVTPNDLSLDCNTVSGAISVTTDATVLSWTGPNGFSSTDASPTVSEAGQYEVTVEGDNGCTNTATVEVTMSIDPPSITVQDGGINCNQIQLTLNAVTNGDITLWRGPNNFLSTEDNPVINVAGDYTVEVEGANGCIGTATLTVAEDFDAPTAIASGGTLDCNNASVQLSLDDLTHFVEWTGPNGFVSSEETPSIDEPGMYRAELLGANGCPNTIEIEVVEDLTIPTATLTGGELTCEVTEIQLSSVTNGTVVEWTGPNSFSSTEDSPSVSESGMYTLTVMGTNGCTHSESIEITEDITAPELSTEPLMLNCEVSSGALSATTNGSIVGWTGPDGFSSTEATPVVGTVGTYEVTVQNDKGCTSRGTVEVIMDTEEPVITTQDLLISCSAAEVALSATTAGTVVGWTGPDGYSSSDAAPMVSAAGEYMVEVMGANGCTATATLTITEDFDTPTVSTVGGELNCNNDMRLTLSTTTNATSVSWTGPNGFSSTEINPEVSEAGTYTVTASYANGCTSTADAMVVENVAEPVVNVEDAELNCANNNQILLTAQTDDAVVMWQGPDGFTSFDESPMISIPGDYTATVQGVNGCTATASLTITQDNELPTVTTNNIDLDCSTPSALLSATTSATIVGWSGPDDYSTTEVSPEISEPGEYMVTVMGANGCEATATLTVTANTELPSIDLSANGTELSCGVTSLSLSAQTSATVVGWTGPGGYTSSDAVAQATVDGAYTVTVRSDNGCENTETIDITMNSTLPIIISEDKLIDCNNPDVTLTITTDGVSYTWTGPAGFTSQDEAPTVSAGGMYEVTVTGANGCTATAQVMVDEDFALPTVTTTDAQLECDNNAQASLSFSSGATFLRWLGPEGYESTDQNPQVQVPGEYTIEVVGANGCIGTATSMVSGGSDLPSADLSVSNVLTCDVTSATISATTVDEIVEWTAPDGSVIASATPTVGIPGSYTVTLRNADGCLGYSSIEVVEDITTPDVVLTGGALSCTTDELQLGISTNGTVVEWTGPAGFSSTDMQPMVSTAGTYEVEVVGANGCIATQQVEITENIDAPAITLSQTGGVSCQSAGATLNIQTAGQLVEWTGPAGFSETDASPIVYEPGVYTATVVGANGCTASEEIEVEFEEFSIEIGEVIGSCEGVANGTFTITNVTGATPPFSFSANGQVVEITSLPYTVEDLATGLYTFIAVNDNGCTDEVQVTIEEDRELDVAIDAITINPLGEYDLSLEYDGEIDRVIWEDTEGLSCYDCINPMVTIEDDATFNVTVYDANGCVASTGIALSANGIGNIYMPNIIDLSSLNGNGKFYPQGNTSQNGTYDMQIFDRWGNKVFEEVDVPLNSKLHGWSGMFNNRTSATGVYVYCVTVYNEFGGKKTIKGDVTVIR